MEQQLTNIFERVIASAARMKEIREIRYNSLETGTYVPGMYKKLLRPDEQAIVDLDNGIAGRDYLYKAVSKPRKRRNPHDVKTR
jgi:hypothetical protein